MERYIGEVLLLGSIFLTINNRVVAHELCIWESVTAFCAADEVVFIETANYGRFRNSRCYSFKENETSCSADIRLEMQMRFGVPQNISYPVAEDFFTTRSPECLQGRMPSIEVSYRCVESISSEVCFHETFSAACSSGTVIYIQSAFYGRMHSSRCIYFDSRDLHCYADVQLYFESLCNGRAECSIRASNDTLRNANRCRTNLKPYLEVFYKCAPDELIRCDKFNASEDVTMEDIANGHRLSCTSNRNISWEVHCVNETWVTDIPRRCPTSTYPAIGENYIRCAKFNPPENVAVEDIVNGYRLSCTDDRNISWEVHCVNETWILSNLRSCSASNQTKPEVEMPFATERNLNDDQSFIKKIVITVPSATGGLIIFLITVAVCIHKHRQRNRKRKSSCSYVEVDDIQSMKCARYGEITSAVVPNPRPTTPPLVAPRPDPEPPTINEVCRQPPEPSIYMKLIPQGDTREQPTSGATISVPLDLGNFKVTLNITVDKETELQ